MDQASFELLCLVLLPAAAAVVAFLLGPDRRDAIRWVSLAASLVVLVLAMRLAGRFIELEREHAHNQTRKVSEVWVPTFRPEFVPGAPGVFPDGQPDRHGTSWDLLNLGVGRIQFYIGVDGLNVWLVVLTAVLMLPSVLISWNHIETRVNEFYGWLLLLQTAMMGIFVSFDIVLFYVFFELSLVPLFFLIGVWGGPQRRYAARKFFIYTLTGSLITLLGVLGVVLSCAGPNFNQITFSIPRLVEAVHVQLASTNAENLRWWGTVQYWVFVALTLGFAIKVPLVPLHTWLPLAHVEAPTAGSVDLAGVLLKVGAYGFLRLCVPLAPDVSLSLGMPLVSGLAAFGIVWGALCAYGQDDVKKLIAYSSVSHLGLCMLGMFALNMPGLAGSLMQMINHGLSTAALFLIIGMLYERYHTRKISDYGGMAAKFPLFGVFMVFTCLASAGMPGLNGFIGEVLALAGVFEHEVTMGRFPWLALVGASGVFFGAWYLFTMVRKVFFGPVKEPAHDAEHPITDMTGRELAIIVPIAILCVVLGIHPQPVLRTAEPDLKTVVNIATVARDRAQENQLSMAQSR